MLSPLSYGGGWDGVRCQRRYQPPVKNVRPRAVQGWEGPEAVGFPALDRAGGWELGRRILAVDDDPVIQRLLRVNLEMEDYEVAVASDGVEALEQVRAFRPDLVLLDVMMPVKDGWQVCVEMKGDPDLAEIPVVFLSARAQEADVERGAHLGADAYVTKPFDPLELLALVARLLGDG